jgi:hypothetical protein
MKLTPLSTPTDIKQVTTNETASRSKAIEAFMRGTSNASAAPQAAQEHPVQNPNQVAPEEMTAVKTPTQADQNIDSSTTSEVTEAASEVPKAAIEEPKQKDPEVEKRFTELARQERILRAKAQKQSQELKTREDALKAREDAINAKSQEYDKGYIAKSRFKADPLGALAEAETNYDELTQLLLNQQPKDPRVEANISRLEAQIKQLEGKLDESAKNQTQRQADDYKNALKQIERDAINLVKDDPTTYEAIAKTKSISDVVELIEQTYQKDGILLSVEEAAQEVENYLVEEGYKAVTTIDKIKKRLAQQAASTAPAKPVITETQAKPQQTQPAQMKTLTNATSSTRKLSARERALLAFKGELKS